jgi:hypothetical protein
MVDQFGLQVRDVCLFQVGDPSGYVIHDEPRGYIPTFAISMAPFFLNTAVAYAVFVSVGYYLATNPIDTLNYTEVGSIVALVWVGISAGWHAFPSTKDTINIWEGTKRQWWNPLAILGIPVILLLLVLNKTKIVGSNLLFVGLIAVCAYTSTTVIVG